MIHVATLIAVLGSSPPQERERLPGPEERGARMYECYLGDARSLARSTLTVQVAAPEGDVPESNDILRLSTTAHGDTTRVYYMAGIRAMPGGGCGGSMSVHQTFERVERDGRVLFEARFENVPDLEHSVFVLSDRLIEQRVQSVRPGETVRFVYQRIEPEHAYGFRVTRAGAPELRMPRYTVWPAWSSLGPVPADFPLAQKPAAGGVHRYRLGADQAVEWCVWLRGFRRVYGDRAAFLPAAAGNGYWANVELAPGFAVRMRAVDTTGQPLAGVHVRFDANVFVTDAQGLAYVESADPEPHTRIAIEGFAIEPGDVAGDGTFGLYQHGLHVVLR